MFNLDQVTLIDANAVLEDAYKNAVIALFNAGYSKERLIEMMKTILLETDSGIVDVSFESFYDTLYLEDDEFTAYEATRSLNSTVFSNESQEQGDLP